METHVTEETTTPRTTEAQRPTTAPGPQSAPARSGCGQTPEIASFERSARASYGRRTLAWTALALPACVGTTMLATHLDGGDVTVGRAVALAAVSLVLFAVLGVAALKSKLSMPKYAYLHALSAPQRAEARGNLRHGTPSHDPVQRFAETQQAEWARETGGMAVWLVPTLVAVVVACLWATLPGWGWLSNLPIWAFIAAGAGRLLQARRERASATAYLRALD